MPLTNLSGKTKADLVVLAELSGLLTQAQAKKMTRAAIAEFLQKSEEEGSGQTSEKSVSKTSKAEKPAVRRTRSSAAAKTEKPAAKKEEAAQNQEAGPAESEVSEKETKKPPARRRSVRSGSTASAQSKSAANSFVDTSKQDSADLSTKASEKDINQTLTTEIEEPKNTKPAAKLAPKTAAKTAKSAKSEKPEKPEKTEKSAAAKKPRISRKKPEHSNESPVTSKTAADADKSNQVSEAEQPEPESVLDPAIDVLSPRDNIGVPAEAEIVKNRGNNKSERSSGQHPAGQKRNASQRQSGHNPNSDRSSDQRQQIEKPAEENKPRSRPIVEAGELVSGALEIMPDGYGFLRKDNYLQGSKDIYVPPQYIRRFGLRTGDLVVGPGKQQRDTDRYQALLYIKEVNGMPPEKMVRRPQFDRLTPIYPDSRYRLETARNELSTRIIDLAAPIGKGQRGMIVSPPKAGKTILLQKIANAISINNPEVKLIVLLIDERPEEVTDMQRSIKGEVVYSTFDKTPENHVKVTELVLERAMRLVELKQDVVILLDSMTRLARAYNLTINPTGRTLSGGLDPGALYGPKRFFGSARNIENGGSLTIIATSLIETGSRMDEVIFEEFKGTGNMEVYLDRKLSEKRIFPAIDINRSGTRREELLMTSTELDAVWTIRKAFSQLDTASVTETIINLLLKTQNNDHFISSINVSFNDKNVFDAMRGTRTGNGNAPATGQGNSNGKQY